MARHNGSWRRRREKDPYVKAAQQDGWRSRAVFKLQALDERERLFKPGMRVLDLGAAPGGWSQYAASKVSSKGRVAAVDVLDMEPLPGVDFIHGDVCRPETVALALVRLGGRADLVISDMAPNMTGVASVDVPRALALAEVARDVAGEALTDGGALVAKLFQGEGVDEYMAELKRRCVRVATRKPAASRPESREIYVVARF